MDGVDLDSQDLAEPGIQPLGVALRIATGAAVAQTDVEVVVWPEEHDAAVVVRVWLLLPKQDLLAVRISEVGVITDGEAGDDGVPGFIGEIDIEEPGFGVVRGESEPEQALLVAAGTNAGGEINERRLPYHAILHDADQPALLQHEEATGAVVGVGDEERLIEAVGDELETDIEGRGVEGGVLRMGRHGEQEGKRKEDGGDEMNEVGGRSHWGGLRRWWFR